VSAVQAQKLEELHAPLTDVLDESAEDVGSLDQVRIPHITIDVFRETDAFASVWSRASEDRRMVSTTTRIHEGGFPAAIRKYTQERTPELIIVETDSSDDVLEMEVDSLAEVCDPNTNLIIVGHRNDIALYQKLLNMGVANYMVYPVTIASIISAISEVYREPGKEKIGKVTAVIGAKGGVGASSIAQNLALEFAEASKADVLLVDLDLSFGTSSLNLDIEANQGLSELIDQAERIDVAMLDRVLVKRGMHLNLVSSMPSLQNHRQIDEFTVERLLDVATTHIPEIVLDLPHGWTDWVRRSVVAADRVVVVATPELGCLRNATAMMNELKSMRPNDKPPHLVLNQVGMPRRQEITTTDIEQVLKIQPMASVPFDAKIFSQTAAAGKMVAELGRKKPVAKAYGQIAQILKPPKRATPKR
jgi:pilus assembly protein CpaE